MSICSKVGIEWVKARVQTPHFKESALLFLQDVGRRLKVEKPLSSQRMPEPSEQDAWSFTRGTDTMMNYHLHMLIWCQHVSPRPMMLRWAQSIRRGSKLDSKLISHGLT